MNCQDPLILVRISIENDEMKPENLEIDPEYPNHLVKVQMNIKKI